jgi:hypothetical protein
MYTAQPITRLAGIAHDMMPPGSTAVSRTPGRRPLAFVKNHQGTPFIAVTTTVSVPSSGPMRNATSGKEGAFTAMMT